MTNAYVVRELVRLAEGERHFLTHYEYGTFRTYEEANKRATETHNPRCFPQQDALLIQDNSAKQHPQDVLP